MLFLESLWYIPVSGSKVKEANETAAYHPVNLAATAGAGSQSRLEDFPAFPGGAR